MDPATDVDSIDWVPPQKLEVAFSFEADFVMATSERGYINYDMKFPAPFPPLPALPRVSVNEAPGTVIAEASEPRQSAPAININDMLNRIKPNVIDARPIYGPHGTARRQV